MRKFEIVFIIIFIQIGFIITGLVQVNNSTFLLTPYVNSLFLGSLTGLGNGFMSMTNSLNELIPQIGLLLSNKGGGLETVVSLLVNGSGFVLSLLGVFGTLLLLLLGVLVIAILCSAPLYIAIFASILPQTMGGTTLAITLGTLLWLIQTCIVIWDISRSMKSLSLGAVNTLTWDLDDTAGGVFRGEQKYSWKGKNF